MADEKDKKIGQGKPERLEERKIPDLNKGENNDPFNKIKKGEDRYYSDKGRNDDGYISKPRISSELPPTTDE